MKDWTLVVVSLVSLAAAAVAHADLPANTLTESEQRSGWRLLFDGKTSDGWRNYRQEGISNGWKIEDGLLIRADKGAGDIITNETFEAFELQLDYRISEGGNSGLMFRVSEEEDRPWKTGPEVQIQDNVAGHDPQKAGWVYLLYKPGRDRATGETNDATRPAGEWNQIYLRVTPQNCVVMLNGVNYSNFQIGSDDWKRRVAASKFKDLQNFGTVQKGHICLQDHNDVVAFRNIKIRELAADQSVPDPSDGELPLTSQLAFPNLKWENWEPVNEQGVPEPFRPIFLTTPAGDNSRLFLAEQRGRIWSFENRPDVTESKLFLDVRDRVNYSDRQNEEGLLGFAFHPKFKENGQFFLYYTEKPGMKSVISRFQVKADNPLQGDPDSEVELLRIEQPFWNHNGGTLVFGPDGYLYIGLGDGGAANDPYGNGQNLGTLLGSILRIDVDNPQDGKPYGIPADNPFVKQEGARPEIYAHGVRNVWRIAFDRETGTLWAGDVGQNLWEEIDIIVKGGNYGWNLREGLHPFGNRQNRGENLIDPVWEYDHQVGKSITGGNVYRGKRFPELVGKYLYADYVTGKIWALSYDADQQKVTRNDALPGNKMPVMSFGEDAEGETYFLIVAADGRGIYTFTRP